MAGSHPKEEVPRPQPQRQTGEVGVAPTLRSVRSCFLSSPSAVWPGLGRSDSPDCREALSPSAEDVVMAFSRSETEDRRQ
ncbi:Hypothetical predicted protein [Lynx pardinus]|uniref:Uncharacterized protein n=1 Tax=Lynx pardinus TaxID=191816 RepID=A0A485NEH8_LYNPA|nr:Hypothetical predicted protein [Lynx pardinus]